MKNFSYIIAFAILAMTIAVPTQAKHKFIKSKGQQLSYREASFFANTAEKRDIIIGAEVLEKSEQIRLFGRQVGKFTVLEVAISNNSRFRLYVNDITLVYAAADASQESVSLDDVAKAIGPSGGGNKKSMQLSILRNNLIDKNLQTKVILPGETIQGLVFVRGKNQVQGYALRMDLQNLKRLVYLDIVVPLAQ